MGRAYWVEHAIGVSIRSADRGSNSRGAVGSDRHQHAAGYINGDANEYGAGDEHARAGLRGGTSDSGTPVSQATTDEDADCGDGDLDLSNDARHD